MTDDVINLGEQLENSFTSIKIVDNHDGSASTETLSLEQLEDDGETLIARVNSKSEP